MADQDDLRLNTLDRYRKTSRQLALEVHSHCEVPAGCGGVVLRWRNPNSGLLFILHFFVSGKATILLDGKALTSARPLISFGEHVLSLAVTDIVSDSAILGFAEVLAGYHPGLFARWWQDAFAYANRAAGEGSALARSCIRSADASMPSAHDAIFHNFSFAFVGRRDADGQFICREEFYNLSRDFYAAYQECIQKYLLTLASDVFGEPPATR